MFKKIWDGVFAPIWDGMMSLVPEDLVGKIAFYGVIGCFVAAIIYCWVGDFLSRL